MRFPAGPWTMALAAVLASACAHSDPTGPWTPPDEGPLTDDPPIRLTYSVGTDVWPTFSQDGSRLLYAFELGTPDRDRCLGVLPGRGGQRVAEVCGVDAHSATRDGFEHGALSSRGLLAFTRHSGDIGGPTAAGGSLYLAPLDSLAGARRVLELKTIVNGAARRWDYLLDPVWISDDELAFVGTQVAYVPPGPFLPEDTIYTGLDLATIRLDGTTPVVTVLADLQNAQALAWDPTLERFAFLRNDSVFTIGASGGTETFTFALTPEPGSFDHRIAGVAGGGGKLWITWTSTMAVGTTSTRTMSLVSEIRSDGSLTTLASRELFIGDGTVVRDDGTWERLTASGDGRKLAVEGRFGPTGDDLYLIDIP